MKIKVITCNEQLKMYAEKYVKETCEDQWESLVVDPFWKQLCCYSPMNLDKRKPKCITDIDALKRQINELEQIDFAKLEEKLTQIANTLPNYDDDPISVWIVPIDDSNSVVEEQQNGVIGTSLFGNIMIQVNPLVSGYEEWISYVFAHEYHHTVWGNYWFNLHGKELKHDLMQALIIDGEADSFAMSICKELKPEWLYLGEIETIENLYRNQYEQNLSQTDFNYSKMMFGDKKDICWCGGYAVGYLLVQNYLMQNDMDFRKLLEIHPDQIMNTKKVEISFRYATEEDVSEILFFIKELASYEKMIDEVVATEDLLKEWLFEKKKAEVIFLMEGDKNVGFALFFHNFSTFLGRSGIYLEDLYVKPEYRGKGYGKAILQELARIAVERGCGRLEWWCLDWNQPSIDFYLSLGAEPMKDWTVYRIAGETLKQLGKKSDTYGECMEE